MIEYPYICPKCKERLHLEGKSYYCPNKHCFDLAKSGYVNLVLVNAKHSADPGDNKEMIQARVQVMNDGYYNSLADCIADIIKEKNHTAICDVGCGVGSITGRLKEFFPGSLIMGSDISKSASFVASKLHKNISFCVASSNALPLENESQDVVICAFAPVFDEEFFRILKPNGTFIRVVPDVMHLFKLKQLLYETPRVNEVDTDYPRGFKLEETRKVADDFVANGSTVSSLVKMTPYYYHTRKEDLERLFAMPTLTTNRAFEVRVYKKENSFASL